MSIQQNDDDRVVHHYYNGNERVTFYENDEMDVLTLTKLDPTSVPTFLGGWPKEGKRDTYPLQGVKDTVFGKLKRAPLKDLPGIHSKEATFSDQASEATFRKLYHGDFTLALQKGYRAENEQKYLAVAVLEDSDDENGSSAEELVDEFLNKDFSKEGVLREEPPKNGIFRGVVLCLGFKTKNQQVTGDLRVSLLNASMSINFDQMDALHRRFEHIFLRTHGASLDYDQVLFPLYESLKRHYLERKWWKEVLDLSIINADATFSVGRNKAEKLYYTKEVGEFLTTRGKYETAAKLFLELANQASCDDSFLTLHPPTPLAFYYLSASTCFAKAGKFDQAEETGLQGLHHAVLHPKQGTHSWEKVEPYQIKGVLDLYLGWHTVQPNTSPGPTFMSCLLSLFLVGKANAGDNFFQKRIEKLAKASPGGEIDAFVEARATLKANFMSKKAAQKALSCAIKDPSNVEHFRSTILHCALPAGISRLLAIPWEAHQRPELAEPKKHFKAQSRSFVQGLHTDGSSSGYTPCSHCMVEVAVLEIKLCQCRHAAYCGKGCQVADWKRHKTECPYSKRNKAKAKK